MPNVVRLHATIRGLVQGVSFRYYTYRQAQILGLHGYVRNRWDSSVEVVAEGELQAVEKLLSWLRHGPPGAEVEGVDYEWQDAKGDFRQFEVRL